MNPERFGDDYGGWWIVPDLIPNGTVIIDGGIGTNTTFIDELSRVKDVFFIGIDPSPASWRYIESRAIKNYLLFPGAVSLLGNSTSIYDSQYSESCFPDHRNSGKKARTVNGISIAKLRQCMDVSLIKLDIEGMEYEMYRECLGVRQLCIEWHHRMISRFSEKDTDKCKSDIQAFGYKIVHETDNESLFVLI